MQHTRSNGTSGPYLGVLGVLYVALESYDETLGPNTNESCELFTGVINSLYRSALSCSNLVRSIFSLSSCLLYSFVGYNWNCGTSHLINTIF